jgi:hypothetical protein
VGVVQLLQDGKLLLHLHSEETASTRTQCAGQTSAESL